MPVEIQRCYTKLTKKLAKNRSFDLKNRKIEKIRFFAKMSLYSDENKRCLGISAKRPISGVPENPGFLGKMGVAEISGFCKFA